VIVAVGVLPPLIICQSLDDVVHVYVKARLEALCAMIVAVTLSPGFAGNPTTLML
jgi:hypothetical protein